MLVCRRIVVKVEGHLGYCCAIGKAYGFEVPSAGPVVPRAVQAYLKATVIVSIKPVSR